MNIQTLAAITQTAKARAANSPRWIKAIDRAAASLLDGSLIVTTLHNGALVTSKNGTYHVNGRCECKAAQFAHSECIHRAAARLVDLYESAPAPKRQAPKITRSVERDRLGARHVVVRCDGWMI
ncbi:MAG: hypothetical protein ACREAM_27575 [Blastocatellia bacterium]